MGHWRDKEPNNPAGVVTSTDSWAKVSNTLLPPHQDQTEKTQGPESQLPPKITFTITL